MLNIKRTLLFLLSCFLLTACGVSKGLHRSAQRRIFSDSALQTAHVGISIYEPATGKWWYNYQGDKYFVPASNTKIATAYAAMKYLGDSLVGLHYTIQKNTPNRIIVQPTGDPTFLHPDFAHQPVLRFFQKDTAAYYMVVAENWKEEGLGSGWTWNDYDAYYMAERSAFPLYGNVVRFTGSEKGLTITPSKIALAYGGSSHNADPLDFKKTGYRFSRKKDQNVFLWEAAATTVRSVEVPFITSAVQSLNWLKDTVRGLKISQYRELPLKMPQVIYSQPTDSLLTPMMHRSDNFFAEQTLLMVSNKILGYMNDASIIDTLLKTDFANLPHPPRWVDGSGLSRYNLFSPQDFVAILGEMKTSFGMNRIREIFPAGNEGTLTNYYKSDTTYLYAKTGTLSGVVALSGYLTTASGKELIFSVLINNHQASATAVRRAVEAFLQNLRQNH